ncbi:Putative aliphatic sulfonates-binding protein precursor [Pantoea agglomerans]|uniref:Aliphatic sulfonates-binding protein n=1 Tax=Enterobacter agglomerans TaxID=549 RepID=A0A379AI19_ENTAG|nr:Putative aliphatic sulfonates-binding protein precursor [Pantoea agglomerans]
MKLRLGKWLVAGLLLAGLQVQAAESDPSEIRIGYQKGSVSMVLAKSHQLLEKRFPHTRIKWIEFPAGPQMLEALNINSIDLGSTGDLPPAVCPGRGRGSALCRRGAAKTQSGSDSGAKKQPAETGCGSERQESGFPERLQLSQLTAARLTAGGSDL